MIDHSKEYANLGLIVAVGQNKEIGSRNNLIWRIKEDLDFFKNVTTDSYVIMGKNTYESMPKNLPRRKYIVLSRSLDFNLELPKIVHHSLEETLEFVSQRKNSDFWVIGGGIVYANFLPYIYSMHITRIYDTCSEADTFFPEFNENEWQENIGEELYCPENGVNYRHVLCLRK